MDFLDQEIRVQRHLKRHGEPGAPNGHAQEREPTPPVGQRGFKRKRLWTLDRGHEYSPRGKWSIVDLSSFLFNLKRNRATQSQDLWQAILFLAALCARRLALQPG